MPPTEVDIEQLSVPQRLDLIARIWDSIPDTAKRCRSPSGTDTSLERRLAAADANPGQPSSGSRSKHACGANHEPAIVLRPEAQADLATARTGTSSNGLGWETPSLTRWMRFTVESRPLPELASAGVEGGAPDEAAGLPVSDLLSCPLRPCRGHRRVAREP